MVVVGAGWWWWWEWSRGLTVGVDFVDMDMRIYSRFIHLFIEWYYDWTSLFLVALLATHQFLRINLLENCHISL